MTEFGTLDIEGLQEENKRLNTEPGQQNNRMDDYVPMPKVKPGQKGSITLRILPPLKGDKLFQYTRLHMINGRMVHCPRPLVGGKWDRNVACPICDYYSALWRQIEKLEEKGRTEEADKLKVEARAMKPIERYYYNAIVRKYVDDKGVEHINMGPRVLSVGKILHKKIITAIIGDEAEKAIGDVTHPKNGFDFVIRIEVTTGKDNFPKYDASGFARESSPLGTAEEIKNWMGTLHNLPNLRQLKSFDELEVELAKHRGLIVDETAGFDIDKFDAKYRKDSAPAASARVTEDNVHNVVGGNTEAEVAASPEEDLAIDDQAFLDSLGEAEKSL